MPSASSGTGSPWRDSNRKKMTVLVDGLAAEAEIPIDHFDGTMEHEVLESGLFGHLASRGVRRRFGRLEMPLGKAPVLVGVADEEKPHLTFGAATKDDAAGARFALGAGLGLATLAATAGHEIVDCGLRIGPGELEPRHRARDPHQESAIRNPQS